VRWFPSQSLRVALALAALGPCCALEGCGRIGFEALPDRVTFERPSSAPDEDTRNGGAHSFELDGGTPHGDAADGGGSDGLADAGATNPDDGGASTLPEDGGAMSLPPDSCQLVPDALACANFNRGRVRANMWIAADHGDVDLSNGYLDACTWASDGYAAVVADFDPVTSGSLYMRISMLIPGDADLSLVNFAALKSSTGDYTTGIDFNFNYDELEVYLHEPDQSFIYRGFSAPRDEWFCFVARVGLGDGNGQVETWIEDRPLHDERDLDTLWTSGVDEADLGLPWVHPSQSDAHIIVDDWAVSPSPLTGCP